MNTSMKFKAIKVGDKIELKRYIGKYTVEQIIEQGVFAKGRCGVTFYKWDEIL